MNTKISVITVLLSLILAFGICAQEEGLVTDLSGNDGNSSIRDEQGSDYSEFESFPVINPALRKSISLSFKNMDVVEALKILATRGNINLVIGSNVSGKVTLILKEVSIRDAFEIIISSCDLAFEYENQIVKVMTQKEYEASHGRRFKDTKRMRIFQLKHANVSGLLDALNQMKSNFGKVITDSGSNTVIVEDTPEKIKDFETFIQNTDLPIQTKVFNLNYAKADKIQEKIQEVITKNIGAVRIDERTNKIVVSDFPEKLNLIEKIIAAFDEKSPQVLIDAQILAIIPYPEFKNGVDWNNWLKNNFSLSTVGGNNLSVGIANDNKLADNDSVNSRIVGLLHKFGSVEVISSPYIAAINNQETKILMGTKEVYVSQVATESEFGSKSTTDQVNFVDVGVKLCITPVINRDGFISMKVRPEVSSVKDYYKYGKPAKSIPIVETSETETNFIVRDGATVIIAGLKKDVHDQFIANKELVVILTARTFSGDSFIPEANSSKLKEVSREIGLEYYKLVTDKINFLALAKQPEGLKGQVQLSFTIAQNGKLISNPVIVDANNPELISYAKKAVMDASPFPNLPKNFKKDKVTFGITLNYE